MGWSKCRPGIASRKSGGNSPAVHSIGTVSDAGARWPGNRLQPGRNGFNSHRRLLKAMVSARASGARCPVLSQAVGDVRSVHGFYPRAGINQVSSVVEHQTVTLAVAGSTPVPDRRLQTCSECGPRVADACGVGPGAAPCRAVGSTAGCHAVRGFRLDRLPASASGRPATHDQANVPDRAEPRRSWSEPAACRCSNDTPRSDV